MKEISLPHRLVKPSESANSPPEAAPEFIPTRKSLLTRLKNWEDNESWRDFFNTYWKLIYGVALKAGLTHTEAEEVLQETVLGVARSIGEFKYDAAVCSFKSWLMQVIRHRIARQFDRRKRQAALRSFPDETSRTPVLERLPDQNDRLEALWEEEWEKNLMDAALARVKRRVPMEQYQIFDFYVLKKWPALKVARNLGVTVGHVYVAKHRISRLLQKEVRVLQERPL